MFPYHLKGLDCCYLTGNSVREKAKQELIFLEFFYHRKMRIIQLDKCQIHTIALIHMIRIFTLSIFTVQCSVVYSLIYDCKL